MLLLGDCQNKLKDLEEGSVDCIVTDPPYGYSFMGKDWDKAVVGVDTWKECLRVLKAGSFAFVMSAPRQDVLSRMIVNLTDAGFKMDFTSLYWTYACISEDTEVLTQDGWKNLEQLRKSTIDDMILVYDKHQNTYSFERPERWQSYRVKDTCYRIKGDSTDQLVTGNHRCLVADHGVLLDRTAEEIGGKGKSQVDVPVVESVSDLLTGVYNIKGVGQERQRDILLKALQREAENQAVAEKRKARSQDERGTEASVERVDEGREELGVERRSDDVQEEGQLQEREVRSVSEGVSGDGKEGRLHNGASPVRGAGTEPMPETDGSGASRQPRPRGQQARELNAVCNEQGTQAVRAWKASKASVERCEYDGVVYCPTTSTGYFVARRNGKIFITGNSGFPKAGNIGKMVDKRLGVEREVVGKKGLKYFKDTRERDGHKYGADKRTFEEADRLTAPASDQAKALDGSYAGFQPKPAVEVIIVCMKPLSEKTYVDQALKNGKGITWLDDCRVPTGEGDTPKGGYGGMGIGVGKPAEHQEYAGCNTSNPSGRFPANLICSDDVLKDHSRFFSLDDWWEKNKKTCWWEDFEKRETIDHETGLITDIGSRPYDEMWDFIEELKLVPRPSATLPFLITPKASKREKNEGLEGFETKEVRMMNDYGDQSKHEFSDGVKRTKGTGVSKQKNHHPCCKPVKLLSYLITLGSREGDTVLDPFMGSGTTGVAAKKLNRNFIGVEMEEEYMEIAKARIASAQQQKMV